MYPTKIHSNRKTWIIQCAFETVVEHQSRRQTTDMHNLNESEQNALDFSGLSNAYRIRCLLVHQRRNLIMAHIPNPFKYHWSSFTPLAYPSLLPLNVSLSFVPPFAPDAIGVPTLETAAVERPSPGVVSSKSWSSGCFSVSSLSLSIVAVCFNA